MIEVESGERIEIMTPIVAVAPIPALNILFRESGRGGFAILVLGFPLLGAFTMSRGMFPGRLIVSIYKIKLNF